MMPADRTPMRRSRLRSGGEESSRARRHRREGIDLGLTWFAVLSDGTVIRSPKFLRRAERKLRRLQKSLARKQPGSSNGEKARGAGGRAPARGGDSPRGFYHKTPPPGLRDKPP